MDLRLDYELMKSVKSLRKTAYFYWKLAETTESVATGISAIDHCWNRVIDPFRRQSDTGNMLLKIDKHMAQMIDNEEKTRND